MRGQMDGGGCFPTGRHYPGIAHLIRVSVEGLAREFEPDASLSELTWVSLDTETTGRDAKEDRIIEVGAVIFRGRQLVESKGWLLDPERPIPPDSTAVHGIKDEDVAGKPTFAQALPEILDFLQGAVPLAYNAEFDRNFFHEELRRMGGVSGQALPPAFRPEVTWLDPLVFARELQKEEKSRALGDVCERLGISLENAHRATDDAEAAGRVLCVFLNDPRVPAAYGAFLKEQRRLAEIFERQRARWRG